MKACRWSFPSYDDGAIFSVVTVHVLIYLIEENWFLIPVCDLYSTPKFDSLPLTISANRLRAIVLSCFNVKSVYNYCILANWLYYIKCKIIRISVVCLFINVHWMQLTSPTHNCLIILFILFQGKTQECKTLRSWYRSSYVIQMSWTSASEWNSVLLRPYTNGNACPSVMNLLGQGKNVFTYPLFSIYACVRSVVRHFVCYLCVLKHSVIRSSKATSICAALICLTLRS